MIMLPMNKRRKMTVVMPSMARPEILSTRAQTPMKIEMMKTRVPHHVTNCMGLAVKLVIEVTAYPKRSFFDHLVLPPALPHHR